MTGCETCSGQLSARQDSCTPFADCTVPSVDYGSTSPSGTISSGSPVTVTCDSGYSYTRDCQNGEFTEGDIQCPGIDTIVVLTYCHGN